VRRLSVRSVGLVIRTRQSGLPNSPCLLGFVACAYQDSYLLYPHTHTTLLRYPYTVIVVVPRSLLNPSARSHIIYVVTAIPQSHAKSDPGQVRFNLSICSDADINHRRLRKASVRTPRKKKNSLGNCKPEIYFCCSVCERIRPLSQTSRRISVVPDR
jgi:hypothetical protein